MACDGKTQGQTPNPCRRGRVPEQLRERGPGGLALRQRQHEDRAQGREPYLRVHLLNKDKPRAYSHERGVKPCLPS